MEDIIRNNQDVVVIVDEAYIDFGGRSALELLDQYENLLVVQTFFQIPLHGGNAGGMRLWQQDTDQVSE